MPSHTICFPSARWRLETLIRDLTSVIVSLSPTGDSWNPSNACTWTRCICGWINPLSRSVIALASSVNTHIPKCLHCRKIHRPSSPWKVWKYSRDSLRRYSGYLNSTQLNSSRQISFNLISSNLNALTMTYSNLVTSLVISSHLIWCHLHLRTSHPISSLLAS
jgi:hypothetical protein